VEKSHGGQTDRRVLVHERDLRGSEERRHWLLFPSQNLYRSNDGGHTFTAIKGAPGGDDYHSVWIDPTNSQRIMLGVDQGATISLNGGESWTPWYNQPTGEFYRVAT